MRKALAYTFVAALASTLNLLSAIARDAPNSLRFSDLKSWIDDGSATTVETLIAKLPKEYLNGYALVYNSRSLQEASFQNPRAILYGTDASFILTFNGSAKQAGYQTVETMQFNGVTDRFELREIKFDGPKPVISEINPRTCLKCHGEEPRPIWDAYFFWPGTYGSQDDLVKILPPGENDSPTEQANPMESREYSKFMASRALHKRYGQLGDPRDFSGKHYRNKNPNENLNSALGALNNRTILRELRAPEVLPYRYAILGAYLCSRDATLGDTLYGRPSNTSETPRIDEEFDIESFIPDRLLTNKRGKFEKYCDNSVRLITDEFARLAIREKQLLDGRITDSRINEILNSKDSNRIYAYPIAPLRFVLESGEHELRNWSMSGYPTKTYQFNNAFATLDSLFVPLWESYVDPIADQDLITTLHQIVSYDQRPVEPNMLLFALNSIGNNKKSHHTLCQQLKTKSVAALETLSDPLGTHPVVARKANSSNVLPIDSPELAQKVMRTCIQCHSTGYKDAPQLAFDQPSVLKRELNGSGYISGTLFDEIKSRLNGEAGMQMPPDTKLPEEEKRSILHYLNQLNQMK